MLLLRCKPLKNLILSQFLTVILLGLGMASATAQEQPSSVESSKNNNDANNNYNNGTKNNNDSESATRSAANLSPAVPRPDPGLQLGVGDLIELTVYDVPDLTTKTRISSTGDIYCPLIGPTHVAGMTTEEAAKLIEGRLSVYL